MTRLTTESRTAADSPSFLKGGRLSRSAVRFLLRLLDRIGVHLDPFYLFLETLPDNPRQDAWVPMAAGFTDFTVTFFDAEDMADLAALEQKSDRESVDTLRARLGRGERCLGARHNGAVVAYSWCDLNRCDSIYYRCDLKANEAYLRDAYTVPEFRGRRLAPYLRHRMHRELAHQGRNRFYSISTWHNEAALNFKHRIGARPILLGVRLHFGRHWNRAVCIRLRTYDCPPFLRDRLRRFGLAHPRI